MAVHKLRATRDEKANTENVMKTSGITSSFARLWPLVAVGVAAAGGLGLIAAALIGVGEAAIAGAAGYLAYRRMTGTPETEREVEVIRRRRSRAA